MARNKTTLDEKIEKAQEKVAATKKRYDAALNELEKLLTKRRELDNKKLIEEFTESKKSLAEVIAFLRGEEPEDD